MKKKLNKEEKKEKEFSELPSPSRKNPLTTGKVVYVFLDLPAEEKLNPSKPFHNTIKGKRNLFLSYPTMGKRNLFLSYPTMDTKQGLISSIVGYEKKPVLVISYDGRYQTLLGVPGIEIINLFDPDPTSPQAWIKTKKLTGELWSLAKDFPYSLIVEDNMTLMGRYAMNWALLLDPKTGLGGSPAQQHYSPQMKAFSDHILSMKELPCHYIVTGHHEYLEVSAEGQVYLLPKVIGKTARTELASWFDETYWVNRKDGQNKKTDYYWITKGNGSQDFFKSTLNKKGVYWDDPVEVDLSKKDTGFRYILKKRFKEIPE